HSARSANWKSDVPISNIVHSGTVTRKPARAPKSAIQRAIPASRSRPTASTASPATIGTQMASERSGGIARGSSAPGPPCQQREKADDHGERIVIDVACLQMPQQRRAPADHTRGAVDEKAVDDAQVAYVRQEAAELAGAARVEPVVELVEV